MCSVRVLLVSAHPVQYCTPIYQQYAREHRLDVTVAYCALIGAEGRFDDEFGRQVVWDVPLLEGYRWVHPVNRSVKQGGTGFWGLVNPGLLPLIVHGRWDIVVCYGYMAASFWIAALAAKYSGAAVVLTTDGHSLASRDRKRWKTWVKRLVLPHVLRIADGVFVSSTRGEVLVRGLRVPRERIFLTPNVVDNQFFSNGALQADRIRVRGQWNIDKDAVVALFCGKLVPWKRPYDLLAAAARIDPLYVVYAGDGVLRGALEIAARDLGVLPRVRFLGFVNQQALPEIYAAADVLVLPSEYEPFGLVVNEAFACRRPAVVSEACGAAGDLVVDDKTGFVVPVADVSTLAERLQRLCDDPDSRRSMGEEAWRRVCRWGVRQNVEAFADACLRITAGRKMKRRRE